MKHNITNIKLHGDLGEKIGKEFKFLCRTVGEAIRAVEYLSGKKLYKYLLEKDKEGVKYKVLINGRNFECQETPTLEKPDSIANSELVVKYTDGIKTVDIIPILEGAGGKSLGIFGIILGVVLIVVSFWVPGSQPILVSAGIGLIAAGVVSLLTKPPKFDDYQSIEKTRSSYLFNGPYNTTEEGGPVPVGYGRLIVGSQVISTSYDVNYFNADGVNKEDAYGVGDLDPDFGLRVETVPTN